MYSDIVMEHFKNPRNVGAMPDADAEASEGNPVCGDLMKMYIKVKGDRIVEVKFQTFGCGAAVASASVGTEMVKGKTLDEAMAITNIMVAEALGGLPPQKVHCSNLAADCVHKAIENYRNKAKAGR